MPKRGTCRTAARFLLWRNAPLYFVGTFLELTKFAVNCAVPGSTLFVFPCGHSLSQSISTASQAFLAENESRRIEGILATISASNQDQDLWPESLQFAGFHSLRGRPATPWR